MFTTTNAISTDKNVSALLQAAFNVPNNNCVIFTAVRNADKQIIDFEFSLLSPSTINYIGQDLAGKKISDLAKDYLDLLPAMINVLQTGTTHNWERHVDYLGKGAGWYRVSDCKATDDVLVRRWEDITEQKKNEVCAQREIARKAEEKYLSLFNATEQGFCIIEMVFDENKNPVDYIFLDYNPAFEKQTGLQNAKGISMKTLAPNHEQHWFDIYGNIATTGKPISFEQTSSELLDGGWYEVSAFPLTGEQDNRVGIIFSDISERKTAEKQQQEFNKLLEEQVKDRTARLDETNQLLEQKNAELQESNKALESFSYVASHDLQEPLRKLQTFTSLLTDRIYNPEQALSYVYKINQAAARMSVLIQDILSYSRITTKIPRQTINLNDVLKHVTSDLEIEIAEKNAIINAESLPAIEGIEVQLRQVFSNLITNSLKYSKNTPVITISHTVTQKGEKETLKIKVQDNGIGFDDKYSEQIFELFKRLHGKSEYDGTGIGLSICKKIIEQHGGTITATSNNREGALFTITIPTKQVQ